MNIFYLFKPINCPFFLFFNQKTMAAAQPLPNNVNHGYVLIVNNVTHLPDSRPVINDIRIFFERTLGYDVWLMEDETAAHIMDVVDDFVHYQGDFFIIQMYSEFYGFRSR
jgi:hypothetical protein